MMGIPPFILSSYFCFILRDDVYYGRELLNLLGTHTRSSFAYTIMLVL